MFPWAAVRDIRLVRDRQTGELRGVAYIQFYRWGAILFLLLFCLFYLFLLLAVLGCGWAACL